MAESLNDFSDVANVLLGHQLRIAQCLKLLFSGSRHWALHEAHSTRQIVAMMYVLWDSLEALSYAVGLP